MTGHTGRVLLHRRWVPAGPMMKVLLGLAMLVWQPPDAQSTLFATPNRPLSEVESLEHTFANSDAVILARVLATKSELVPVGTSNGEGCTLRRCILLNVDNVIKGACSQSARYQRKSKHRAV